MYLDFQMDNKNSSAAATIKCRICLGEYDENSMQALFTERSETDETQILSETNLRFARKVENCCGIKIRHSLLLPTKGCQRCCEFVQMWQNFRQMCLNSQVYLESIYSPGGNGKRADANDGDFIEYLYETLQLHTLKRYNAEDDQQFGDSTTEFDGDCIIDYYDDDSIGVANEEQSDTDEDIEKNSKNTTIRNSPQILNDKSYEDGIEESMEVKQGAIYAYARQNEDNLQSVKVEECYVDYASENHENCVSVPPSPDPKPSVATSKRKPGRPRKPDSELKAKRKTIKESTEVESTPTQFMCNLCGNVYPKKAAFTSHMMAHTDYKPHQCEICCKSFRQMGELRAHIRRHTGERPYKCLYCDRHFYDRSEKVRHERVHTNTRPYECKECGKTFTHTAILKNHMLVHSGEKNFNCNICGKSFTLLHQLKAHLQTLTHRSKEEQANPSTYMYREDVD